MWSLQQSAGRSSLVLRRPSRVPAVQVEAKQVLPAEGRERATLRPVRHLQLPDDTAAVGSQIKYQIKPGRAPSPQPTENPVSDFMTKLKMAWDIFFPERQPDVTPKEEGKQRLRMILVADRCGMSPAGLAEMKKTILKALEEYVDIECEEQIDVAINVDPDVGTVYCVAVPIRRVKPEARMTLEGVEGEFEGMTIDWNPEDWNSDPSARFPYGC